MPLLTPPVRPDANASSGKRDLKTYSVAIGKQVVVVDDFAATGPPILLLHGAMDRVVPVSHSRTMAEAKESNGDSVRYVELPLADHALSREQDRLEVFTELQQFLTKHLE